MPRFEPGTYGDHISAVYDAGEAEFVVSDEQLTFLNDLRGKGPAPEPGIGRGTGGASPLGEGDPGRRSGRFPSDGREAS